MTPPPAPHLLDAIMMPLLGADEDAVLAWAMLLGEVVSAWTSADPATAPELTMCTTPP